MSITEILEKYSDHPRIPYTAIFHPDFPALTAEIEKLLEDRAKVEALRFAGFIANNYRQDIPNGYSNKYDENPKHFRKLHTIYELYALFLTNKNKTDGEN